MKSNAVKAEITKTASFFINTLLISKKKKGTSFLNSNMMKIIKTNKGINPTKLKLVSIISSFLHISI